MLLDAFVSHASEQKKAIASPLTMALQSEGFSLWYDKDRISAGDRLYEKIDEGLKHARYGIVILSHEFFQKNWTKSELAAFFNKEKDGRTVLIPILYGMTFTELEEKSPLIAGRNVIQWDEGLEVVVSKIAKILRDEGSETQSAKQLSPSHKKTATGSTDLLLVISPTLGTLAFEYSSLKSTGLLTIDIEPLDQKEIAKLRSLGQKPHDKLKVAYGLTALEAQVNSIDEGRSGGRDLWTLRLRPVESRNDSLTDCWFNGVSPDEMATMRAKWILLGEKPNRTTGHEIMGDMLFDTIKGHGSRLPIPAPLFPALFADAKTHPDHPQIFLDYARLIGVLFLVLSNTVRHVYHLDLKLVGNKLQVSFEGERPQPYQNLAPAVIRVQGTCVLEHPDQPKVQGKRLGIELF